ncbi:hypothetical protein LTR91_008182 [Friedmanniomyces endolithicus]|uniref:Major facilitator superfamily (MFS) profile domain-containing protein n=1 Tax=Friedmanniomyces endolithicus TaxID=329885 RepID=A0AAN6KN97_9PEZI|nr:hypothetical protein LTR94_020051 [Friedmanniomyces endolithicus]KAK0769643.1 hypothetical protein LTR59_016909 [Friedmanniomyces endolithicus]KAK0774663.1 hypothetical protein LTR38_016129 [Friedmanniomyces endolithicus]KAK0787495.1 hypothetical protein LTR75_012879 [Friedmanniomyces endolithicus]KAK0836997.1 hypothetical protein LTR03_013167 [Friedmanniomyces endolithicus]
MAQSSQSKRGGRTSVLPGEKARTDRWPSANDDNLDRTSSRLGVKPSNPDGSEKALAARASALKRTITGISSASWPDPGPPPDGGRVAWTQAALLHLSTFNTFGYTTAFGSFQTYYESTLGVSPSTISWVGSVQIFLLFFIGTFSGRALDAGYFRHVYITGCVMQIIGIFTTSFATRYWQLFLSQGLCMGIANGLQFTPTMGLTSTYFSTKRALVLGIGALGSCTGGVLFPILVQQLLPRIGFGWTIRIIGFIMLAVDIVTTAFYRTRLPPRRTGPIVEWSAFREAPYALYCTSAFFFFWGLYFAFFYIGSYGRDRLGMSYQDSIDLLLTMVCMGFIFRLVPNYLADRLGALNVMVPFVFLCGIMMFGWIGIRTPGTLYVFAAIYGAGSAGIQSMWPATLASLTSDLSKAGTRMGMGFSVVSFACLTGPPLAGALIQRRDGDYLYALIWAGSSFFVGGILILAARTAKVGWRLRCRI